MLKNLLFLFLLFVGLYANEVGIVNVEMQREQYILNVPNDGLVHVVYLPQDVDLLSIQNSLEEGQTLTIYNLAAYMSWMKVFTGIPFIARIKINKDKILYTLKINNGVIIEKSFEQYEDFKNYILNFGFHQYYNFNLKRDYIDYFQKLKAGGIYYIKSEGGVFAFRVYFNQQSSSSSITSSSSLSSASSSSSSPSISSSSSIGACQYDPVLDMWLDDQGNPCVPSSSSISSAPASSSLSSIISSSSISTTSSSSIGTCAYDPVLDMWLDDNGNQCIPSVSSSSESSSSSMPISSSVSGGGCEYDPVLGMWLDDNGNQCIPSVSSSSESSSSSMPISSSVTASSSSSMPISSSVSGGGCEYDPITDMWVDEYGNPCTPSSSLTEMSSSVSSFSSAITSTISSMSSSSSNITASCDYDPTLGAWVDENGNPCTPSSNSSSPMSSMSSSESSSVSSSVVSSQNNSAENCTYDSITGEYYDENGNPCTP